MAGRNAFTLIELLITAMVISLLALLLMPALKTVREVSRGIGCQNNMRQLSLAYLQYAADHKGEQPPRNGGYATYKPYGACWVNSIYEYLPVTTGDASTTNNLKALSDKLMTCPAAPIPAQFTGYRAALAYQPNWEFFNSGKTRLGAVPGPSLTIILAEVAGQLNGQLHGAGIWPPFTVGAVNTEGITTSMQGITPIWGYTWAWTGEQLRVSHRGRFTFSCVDGHVEVDFPYNTVAIPSTYANRYTPPNRWMGAY